MKLKDLIPEDVAAKNIPSDVKMLKKGKDGNKQIQQYSSRIDTAYHYLDARYLTDISDLNLANHPLTKSKVHFGFSLKKNELDANTYSILNIIHNMYDSYAV